MAVSKIQNLIQKLSESQNVKKVVGDIQNLSTDIQKRVQTLNTNEAVKKYKEIVKKVSKAENDLQKEVNKVITKIKTSSADVEKNLDLYKKKASQQKAKIEKLLKAQKKDLTAKAKKAASRAANAEIIIDLSAKKPKSTKKTTSAKKAKKTTKKRASAKA